MNDNNNITSETMKTFKTSDRIETKYGKGTILEVREDSELKPLVVKLDNEISSMSKPSHKTKLAYFHFNQVSIV